MQPYEIHQRPDGSIDYNRYYARPLFRLTPALRRFFSPKAVLLGAGTLTILIGAALLAASISA